MIRKGSVVTVALALVLAVPAAHAAGGWTIGVNGGVGKAIGDAGREQKIGPNAGIDICMHINDKVAVGAEGSWVSNSHTDVGVVEDIGAGNTYTLNEDKFKIVVASVHAKYMFPVSEASKLAPYGLVGLGLYKASEDYKETTVISGTTTVTTEEDDIAAGTFQQLGSRPGGKIGAGAVYKATETVGITLQADLNIVTVDTGGVAGVSSTFKFYGIRAGINYHVMPK